MHTILRYLTDFGDTAVTTPLAVLMLVCLALTRQWRLALGWTTVVLGCIGTISLLKLVLSVCGPIAIDGSLRSPSGHTAIGMVAYGGYAALIGASISATARRSLVIAAVVFALGIAVSRVVLHFHSASEAVVGLIVGIAALAVLYAIVVRHPPERLPLGWLGAMAALSFLLFYGDRWPAEQALHRFAAFFDILRPFCT